MGILVPSHLVRFKTRQRANLARLSISTALVFTEAALAGPDSYKPNPVEEIVVTAQRRNENLQDVPISISVLSGKELDRSTVTGAVEALRSVPGFDSNIGQYGGGGAIFSLRGVANSARSGGAGTVAYYVDGVPFGFIRESYYPNPGIYDLDRIEVLSGPQGTLYGANALNGVIRVLTEDANANKFELKARGVFSVTEDGGQNSGADLAINVPLIEDRLGVRAIVGFRDDDGWIDGPTVKDLNEEEARDYRLKVHVSPTDTLAINLSAWHSEDNIGAPPLSTSQRRISFDFPQPGATQFDTYGLEITQEFPGFSLSSMTSSIEYGSDSIVYGGPVGLIDNPGAYLDTSYDSDVLSQEFNLVSDIEGLWRWSVGAFYRDVEDSNHQLFVFFNPDSVQTNNNYSDQSQSYAVYGEVGRQLNDQFDIRLGLRYFRDEQKTVARKEYVGEITVPAGSSFESTSEAVTPRVVLTWEPNADRTFYASYSQGFRSGFAQQPNVQVNYPFPPVDPDRLTNYEVGAKGTLGEGRVRYDAAVFYIDWQDIQQNLLVLTPTDPPLNTSATVNGSAASGLGTSFGVTWAVSDGLSLGFNAAWNDLTLDRDIVEDGEVVAPAGARLAASPKWTLGASADCAWALEGGFSVGTSVSASWKSPQNTAAFGFDPDESDDILIANARLSIEAPENWSASLFVDNFTDENGQVIKFSPIPDWQSSMRPRVFGLQLEYRFR